MCKIFYNIKILIKVLGKTFYVTYAYSRPDDQFYLFFFVNSGFNHGKAGQPQKSNLSKR